MSESPVAGERRILVVFVVEPVLSSGVNKQSLVQSLVASMALFVAVTSYPFAPEQQLATHAGALSLLAPGALGYVLTGMNRDELLSRISRTKPEWLSFHSGFLSPFLIYLGPPLLLLISRLPGVREKVGDWLAVGLSFLPIS